MSVRLDRICDGCYRVLGDDEELNGFALNQGELVKPFQGHKECIEEIQTILFQLYGIVEKKGDQE